MITIIHYPRFEITVCDKEIPKPVIEEVKKILTSMSNDEYAGYHPDEQRMCAQIENMLDFVEAELRQKHATKIPTKMIGDLVTGKLKKLDGVAYMRFTSVYRSFKSPKQFAKEVEKLRG